MANRYIRTVRGVQGSQKKGTNFFSNIGGQLQNLWGDVQGKADNVVKDFERQTGLSQDRLNTISEKSESNMILLEKDLEKLDTTLTIYNVTGVILGVTGIVLTAKAVKDWIRDNQS
jgi:hypothetical protein